MWSTALLVLLCSVALVQLAHGDDSTYLIGVGRYDITGPAAGVEMMGYAMPQQYASGIHIRQWSRAFIIADSQNKSRVVFVSIDACMGTQILKSQVVNKLKALYGDLYTNDNVLISGTHTHSAPAGYFQYVMYEIMSLGFVNQTLQALVNGIVESINIAHTSLQPGKLLINSGQLYDASINRSPTAYLFNPPEERAKYDYDTDKGMLVLKMVDLNGKDIGMIDWFAVHCTSMNNTNKLISGDNKGYASMLMEQAMNGGNDLPKEGYFVAAFAQSNEGDVSPNILGPHCIDTGLPCDPVHSTCNGKNEKCIAFGPGVDMMDSTRIIGERQFEAGKALYGNATTIVSGPVDYRHQFVDMTNINLVVNGTNVHTCPTAMGYSFAAGTTDGPGAFNFEQGSTMDNPFWDFVRDILHTPSQAQIECHHPKPILLDTGDVTFPYPWQPAIAPVQLFRIGQLAIIGVPGEFTTMSGRRLRDTVYQTLVQYGFGSDTVPVIAGLANTYCDYITTFEEYQEQRYEAGSTIYGPYTLLAFQQLYANLAIAIAKNQSVDPGPDVPDYGPKQVSFDPPVLFDHVPSPYSFGSVVKDAKPQYSVNDTVEVDFWSGHPRNNLMTMQTFLTVEQKDASGDWSVYLTDNSWFTQFHWQRTSELLGESIANITWTIAPGTPPGTYKIQHFGFHKEITGNIYPYSGSSSAFDVI
eukprot:Em0022g276a